MDRKAFYIINAITLYRLLAAPVLLFLVITDHPWLFSWLLPISFFTDSIDGVLSRRYHVTTVTGARLDSIADDATILSAVAGAVVWKTEFVRSEWLVFAILFGLFLVQATIALIRWRKFTSFHTWLAKAAAILQGCFLILLFLVPVPPRGLFYAAAAVTALDLLEEIIMALILRKWQADVKGIGAALHLRKSSLKENDKHQEVNNS